MSRTSLTIDDLHDLPPTIGVEAAARVLGCGRTLAYELIHRGEFPCRVLRLGSRYVIPTAALLEAIGVTPVDADGGR
jgi:excisionase family DNA binding protein